MARSQTNSGVDLHLELSGPGLRAGLTDALREAVRSGRLAPGSRLPASRTLAADLGIARSTVTECYAELVAEGWLTAQQGSGTRVAERAAPRRTDRAGRAEPAPLPRTACCPARRTSRSFLAPSGSPRLAAFWQWHRRTPSATATRSAGSNCARHSPTICRGSAAWMPTRSGSSICSGFHHGLTLIARALKARGARAVAVEAYGLDLYRALLTDAGLRIPPLGVDEHGARIDELASLGGVGCRPVDACPSVPDRGRAVARNGERPRSTGHAPPAG